MQLQAALFDLGGVVLDVDFNYALDHWARRSRLPADEVRRRFSVDEPYRHHETGALPFTGYFEHLRQLLELDADEAYVRQGWNAILLREIADTVALIDRLRQRVPCHALSNTNAAHVQAIGELFPQLLPRFQRVFVSHEIGHRKPAPESFLHVVQALDVPAGAILFFDDLPENVQAARQVGMDAVLVRGPADVRTAVEARGLL
ncbi:MAG TPA: HAD family phosphatase [Ramlibacter sp.]|nr:HAD family phosphatase [Ramlibacter sp.]